MLMLLCKHLHEVAKVVGNLLKCQNKGLTDVTLDDKYVKKNTDSIFKKMCLISFANSKECFVAV